MTTTKEYLREIMGSHTVICQQIGYIRKEIKELKDNIVELKERLEDEFKEDE